MPREKMRTKEKAIDLAVFLNFKERVSQKEQVVVRNGAHYYVVLPKDSISAKDHDVEDLPTDYSKMSYEHIEHIYTDKFMHPHWEEIKGMVATSDGEILRFILAMKIPLEKFIRCELASRGYDKDHKWVGFDKAREIWLTE